MDTQKLKHSSSSQSHAQQNETLPISDAPAAKKTYPCTYCDKTFSTPMALGGHQNGHKMLKASAKRKAENSVHQPYPAVCIAGNCSYCRALAETSTWRLLDGFYTKMGQPQTTYVPPISNRFSGVRDFLGLVSASPNTLPESSGSGNVIILKDGDKDAPEVDLNLKL